jgi:uncharacterized membrane protein YhaH (DUF805 family)
MNWYLQALRQYATFDGRSRRKEYWYFALFNMLAIVALVVVDSVAGTFSEEMGVGVLSGLYMLAVSIPGLAVSVRRLHDIGRTGWWVLIGVIPLIGTLVLLVLAVLDSQPGANRYGPNPKGVLGPGTPVENVRLT